MTMVTTDINQCTPVNLSRMRLTGMMVVPFPGRNETRSKSQTKKMDIMQIGKVTKNQAPQLGSGCMFSNAIMFCGDAIGEAIPPMHEARAIARTRALENSESGGRFRRIGCMYC